MKDFLKHVLVRGLPALLVLTAAGCGGKSSSGKEDKPADTAAEPAAAEKEDSVAGTYKICGVNMDDAIVTLDTLDGYYLELKDGGSGYLYFGEDNKGDISSWALDGDKFTMKAGVSDFTGTIRKGILELDLGNDNVLTFARDDADTSALDILTMDEYVEKLKEGGASSSSDVDPSAAGDYTIYAAEVNGICVLIPEEDKDALAFTLNEDGTGTVSSEGDSEPMIWKLDGENLSFYETTGENASDQYKITLKDGIMTFYVPADEDGDEVIEYLVREDADTSEIDAKAIDPSTLN